MSYCNPDSLVATEWLARHLGSPGIAIVDATYYLPMQQRNARAEYERKYTPQHNLERLISIYHDVLGGSGSRSVAHRASTSPGGSR